MMVRGIGESPTSLFRERGMLGILGDDACIDLIDLIDTLMGFEL